MIAQNKHLVQTRSRGLYARVFRVREIFRYRDRSMIFNGLPLRSKKCTMPSSADAVLENNTNCTPYPAPTAKYGMNNSVFSSEPSRTTAVDVIRKSFRSLIRARSPITDTPGAVPPEASRRNVPWNALGLEVSPGSWLMNSAT